MPANLAGHFGIIELYPKEIAAKERKDRIDKESGSIPPSDGFTRILSSSGKFVNASNDLFPGERTKIPDEPENEPSSRFHVFDFALFAFFCGYSMPILG
jgi:hypothetical protein